MASVKNCHLPEDLLYNVENNVWARREPDGTVTVGITAYACALAGEVVAYTPKKVGRAIELNKSLVTIESGKWVGPVKAPVSGEVVAVNDALTASPKGINADPYGGGWLVKLKPANWDAEAVSLVTGAAVAAAFQAKMEADGFAGCP
ncbi:MAG TPA: glycine cleavage system protein GcvH [Burkholderiales bacterium]|nr:glycine cleavage system protein GcvH [Burkholderiales bacterium]